MKWARDRCPSRKRVRPTRVTAPYGPWSAAGRDQFISILLGGKNESAVSLAPGFLHESPQVLTQ